MLTREAKIGKEGELLVCVWIVQSGTSTAPGFERKRTLLQVKLGVGGEGGEQCGGEGRGSGDRVLRARAGGRGLGGAEEYGETVTSMCCCGGAGR